jgi:hypothetical protein
MSPGIEINGETLTTKEAMDLLLMFYKDAEELAGQFYDQDRSAKFRVNWPSQDDFVKTERLAFVEAVRTAYALQLGDPKTDPADARRMHLAIILQERIGEGEEKNNRLQLFPNTQQFAGDRYDNRKIIEKFGLRPNLRAALRQGAAKINTIH